MDVESSLEGGILGWVATHPEGGEGERSGAPLVEVLAHDLGLEPNPEMLDRLAAALATLEREERIVLDGPVLTARDVEPLDLARPRAGGREQSDTPPPRVGSYSGLANAPWHVQLNWALRALRDQADPRTGQGETDFRSTVTQLGLNPKDVRHDLEGLGLLRRMSPASGQGPEVWWTDRDTTVTAAALDKLRAPPPPPEPVAPHQAPQRPARSPLADLAPVIDSLTRLEPRLDQLTKQLVEAAESLNRMAMAQGQLLREQSQEIETLRQDRDRLLRDLAELRRESWVSRTAGGRNPAADELSVEASRLRAAQGRLAGGGAEIGDKLRRVTRGLREPGDQDEDDEG